MKQYLEFLNYISSHGVNKSDRTGTGTVSIFGYDMRFDLKRGFPLLTTKKLHLKSIIGELLWFLAGDTNVKTLQQQGITIWNEWADENGELGPIYGRQWRGWQTKDGNSIDQITKVLTEIKNNQDSRRLIVSSWNVGDIPKMALAPCHVMFQFYVANNELSCKLTQRSADAFLGVPFNIASYALLTHMVAQQCDLMVGDFIWSGGDCHIYQNHFAQVELQLQREPYPLPRLFINRKPNDLFSYHYEDFEIVNYQYHPAIKAQVAV